MPHMISGYPRPYLARNSFISLDGTWDLRIEKNGEKLFEGTIEVPFCPESEKSGVSRITRPGERLVYSRKVSLPKSAGMRTILNFLAVDDFCQVSVDGKTVFEHKGGYLPFSVDVTDFVESENTLSVIVTDDTDEGRSPRGKQSLRPRRIWYTPTSGIWGNVWVESVPIEHVTAIRTVPLFDSGKLRLKAETSDEGRHGPIRISVAGIEVEARADENVEIALPYVRPWSPEDPYLYTIELTYGRDRVSTVVGMRKAEIRDDGKGKRRFFLNNRPFFLHALLDQGYWKDTLMTPPCEDAIIKDIETASRLGFNTLRKHVKIEHPLYYYHADRLGMLIIQDMVNGGKRYNDLFITFPVFIRINFDDRRHRLFGRKDEGERLEYERFVEESVRYLSGVTSIAMWTLFNEAWGQFDSARLAKAIKETDPTRPVDSASGWSDQRQGDMLSRHVYFRPYRFRPDRYGRAVFLSEFGGYGLDVEGHSKEKEKKFVYRHSSDKDELTRGIVKLYERDVIPNIEKGLIGSVYTQLTDVERETNGLLTFDREVLKVDEEAMKNIARLIEEEIRR